MRGTTTHVPMTVNDLLNKLKLLPGEMKIQINNNTGEFYIEDVIIDDNCNIFLQIIPE